MRAGGCSSARTPIIAKLAAPRRRGAGHPRMPGPRAWGRHMLEPAKLRVRPATEADLEKILDLYAQTEFDAGDVLPLAAARQVFERFADYPDSPLHVADAGGEIVGALALLVMHNLGHRGAPSAIVEYVAVAPTLQLHGIGKA